MYISPKRHSVRVGPGESVSKACNIVKRPWGFTISGERNGTVFVAGSERDIEEAIGSLGVQDDQDLRIFHTRMPETRKTKNASVA